MPEKIRRLGNDERGESGSVNVGEEVTCSRPVILFLPPKLPEGGPITRTSPC